MTTKRARLIVLAMLFAIAIMIIVAKCVPDVSADTVGPPTIEMYLQSLNSKMSTFIWMGGIVSALFAALIGTLGYAYKRDMANVNEKAALASGKADSAFTEINKVKKDFLSTTNHDRACPHIN